ncbi:hypothetical protein [Methylobacterium sp. Leaf112]|uniref:hypothetical protein n=1 Tax=Methylobacterium sp. Leaf112 TaxID=1736258 RepID=UPI0006F60B57|nr:hypothetical protein [Methylobacterium sp. Leaf112]KQP65211.1 hypothetical protein ASF52_20010 [Methylobacterium sp. Leaf112]
MGGIATRTLGLAIALWAAAGAAQARTSWASGTAVYSDLCLTVDHEPVGHRVTLRRSPMGDTLIYEAALTGPVQAGTVRVDAASKALAFTVDSDGHTLRFTGTLTVEALTGVLEDDTGARPVRLSRILRAHPDAACPDERTGSLEVGR